MPFYMRILGYYRVKTEPRYKTRLQNLLYVAHITAYEEDTGAFLISRTQKERLLAFAKRERLSVSVSELLGLPKTLFLHKHRIGIPIGILLGIFLLFMGTHTVWRVEVLGNERIPAEKIEEALSGAGFGIGSRTGREDYDDIIATVRLSTPEIAWMGIYTDGTTAYVKVIENTAYQDDKVPLSPSHLVASADALILQTDIVHGTAVVKTGSVVKKGDLLVLGLVTGAYHDTILPAEGEVIGRVKEEFSVEIPYKQVEKVETGRKKLSFCVNFFKKEINIFKRTSKKESDYVIIERKERLTLPGGIPLPFGYTVKEAVYYETVEREMEKTEAIREGIASLTQTVKKATAGGEILSRQVAVKEVDGAYVLYATVEYTKNIAERLPYTVS